MLSVSISVLSGRSIERLKLEILQGAANCLQNKENVILTGLAGSARSFVLSEFMKLIRGKMLCLVESEEKAYDLARELRGFINRDRIFMFLGRDFVFMKENYSTVETGRILTLQECLFHPSRRAVIIATPAAFLFNLITPEQMQAATIELRSGEEQELEELLKKLVNSGYSRVITVSRPGEFAVRGGILDVFPPAEKEALRAEFFGDFIDSIRRFNIDTQRSGKKESLLRITPADELYGDELKSTLFNYLPPDTAIFLDEARDFYRAYEKNLRRHREFIREAEQEDRIIRKPVVLKIEKLREAIKSRPIIYHSFFPGNIPQVQVAMMEHISQQEMEPFYANLDIFYSRIKEWQEKGYSVQLAIKSKIAREQLQKELLEQHISQVEFLNQEVGKGFVSHSLELALFSERDIWGKSTGRGSRQRKKSEERILLEDLKLGDYVVHENYGIGIFRGVTQVENGGVTREYILLQYAGTDKLYLPVEKLDLLYKYTTSEEKPPRLSKLGGSEWERTRKKVTESIREMAEDLLRLYATREASKGYAFSPDTPWQQEFESSFPYEETPDQLKCIKEVKRDLESKQPMDRLICGDVGYGKTEVAMRAVFKAIMDGKQAAILVPTTVLAEQHYQTFTERFQEYPCTIDVLSRFRSSSQQKRIIADVQKGVTDIVIGTHRLLSRDVQFKDLGLLVIDEEHRFGVAQKEKIKALKQTVDVISLSATPIPRSLHMSLTGLRDLSLIETPPPERYPITTYVLEYNDEIISRAIRSELEREGQVFFVHNRIEDIQQVYEHLQELLPEVKIAVGHGRMKETELSRTIMEFLHGKYQLLLCTTIIESGLDMPNVNTIIIDEADKMGLAQLYQLRGRVGRSDRIAYAYLTYRPDRILTETAEKRLNAIREFNELGSGMKIALRDLEIRGAGNILGTEQHGYIHAVGFDMYCRLLEQEAARLKGYSPREEVTTQMDIDVDYYIPEAYIPDSGAKMRLYRRLLLATEQQEIEDIRSELNDRFGHPPQPVENFLQIASLRILARSKDIKSLRRKGRQLEIKTVGKLPQHLTQMSRQLKIRRLNDYTLLLNLDRASSLQNLGEILQMI
ncbi:MAG TPA: transcription-repair coupling factor [Gelria sp.]|nr:transcription-repair coupling factor [Gelria sp.]